MEENIMRRMRTPVVTGEMTLASAPYISFPRSANAYPMQDIAPLETIPRRSGRMALPQRVLLDYELDGGRFQDGGDGRGIAAWGFGRRSGLGSGLGGGDLGMREIGYKQFFMHIREMI